MNTFVFLGPSLDLASAKNILDAHYLPPVKMGDIYRLLESEKSIDLIVIIDGLFEQTPAVWHKEILFALSKKIPVIGASSMGALRAAELMAFGMQGHGKIFTAFASGELEDDDEVAVVHGPAASGYLCQSEAMVNIRYGLQLAFEQEIINQHFVDCAIQFAKDKYYPQRTWHDLLKTLQTNASEFDISLTQIDNFKTFIKNTDTNLKRQDARSLLTQIAQASDTVLAKANALQATTAFKFEPTVFWDHLGVYFGGIGSQSGDTSFERLRNHIRLAGEKRQDILDKALLLHLVTAEAKRLRRNKFNSRDAFVHFRVKRKLHSTALLQQWMLENNVNKDECLDLAHAEYTHYLIENLYSEQIDKHLRNTLKLTGNYASVRKQVDWKWNNLKEQGLDQSQEYDTDLVNASLSWYQENISTINDSLEKHAAERGFSSLRLFINELIAHYLATQGDQQGDQQQYPQQLQTETNFYDNRSCA